MEGTFKFGSNASLSIETDSPYTDRILRLYISAITDIGITRNKFTFSKQSFNKSLDFSNRL